MIDIGDKIAAARKAKGYKQFELARRAEIASAQLCKIENGRVNPSFNMVERIVGALDSTIPELLYGEKRKSAAKANRTAAEEPGAQEVAKSGFVPLRVHEPDAAKAVRALTDADSREASRTPVASVCTLVWNKAQLKYEGAGAALAEELRTDLGLGTAPVGDLASALRFRGVVVVETELPKVVGSVAFWDAVRKAPAIVLNSAMTPERRLYRLVYEVGSAALYASLGVRLDESLDQHRFLTDFTAAFLMPGVSVRTCVAASGVAENEWSIEKALPIKSYFGVSAEAFILRLEELGLIAPKLRLALRDKLRAYYRKHPNDMEPRMDDESSFVRLVEPKKKRPPKEPFDRLPGDLNKFYLNL